MVCPTSFRKSKQIRSRLLRRTRSDYCKCLRRRMLRQLGHSGRLVLLQETLQRAEGFQVWLCLILAKRWNLVHEGKGFVTFLKSNGAVLRTHDSVMYRQEWILLLDVLCDQAFRQVWSVLPTTSQKWATQTSMSPRHELPFQRSSSSKCLWM